MSAWRAIATFFAARKLSRIGIDSERVDREDRRRTREVLVPFDREVVDLEPDRKVDARAGDFAFAVRDGAGDRVAERLLEVELERVTELGTAWSLGRDRSQCPASASAWLAETVPTELGEELGERVPAEAS